MSVVGRGLAVLLFAGGCASQLSRPSVPYGGSSRHTQQLAAGLFAAASGAPGETAPAATGSMTMAEAYRLALKVSDPVALAELAIEGAAINAHERNTDLYPNVSINGQGRIQSQSLLGVQPKRLIVGSLDVSQPLFRKGYFAARDAGRLEIESARAAEGRSREQLARDVAVVFVNSVRARKLRDVAVGNVARAKSTADRVTASKKAGGALPSAEQLALLDLKRAERQAVDAQRDVALADATFRRIVGVAPPAELELPATPELPAEAAGLELAKGRKDLKALDLAVQQSRANESAVAGRRWWPRLDLSASAQAGYALIDIPQDMGGSVEVTNDNPVAWNVGAVISIPIYQKGVETVNVERAANNTRIAQKTLELQAKLATEEAQLAAARLSAATRSVELAAQQLKTAKEHFDLINRQFKLGAITFLEVTNAQSVIVEAENANESALMDRELAVYEYLFAIGALDLKKAK
ncbi:MAG TPA: TolC family protein [Kofleriaceae bacterium]|jgi:outer membrane protein|nr:TolC family protein [Kofleriaceae bacterium]